MKVMEFQKRIIHIVKVMYNVQTARERGRQTTGTEELRPLSYFTAALRRQPPAVKGVSRLRLHTPTSGRECYRTAESLQRGS
ncbi:hypothetical protein C0J52_11199 [Blattella germanica]|nr:hypothetical protein C0J52_11199 [Blattella germanica]